MCICLNLQTSIKWKIKLFRVNDMIDMRRPRNLARPVLSSFVLVISESYFDINTFSTPVTFVKYVLVSRIKAMEHTYIFK